MLFGQLHEAAISSVREVKLTRSENQISLQFTSTQFAATLPLPHFLWKQLLRGQDSIQFVQNVCATVCAVASCFNGFLFHYTPLPQWSMSFSHLQMLPMPHHGMYNLPSPRTSALANPSSFCFSTPVSKRWCTYGCGKPWPSIISVLMINKAMVRDFSQRALMKYKNVQAPKRSKEQ